LIPSGITIVIALLLLANYWSIYKYLICIAAFELSISADSFISDAVSTLA
jgi:hypothetical protein